MNGSVEPLKEDKMKRALSPLEPMTKRGREVLRERLIQGSEHEIISDKERRQTALEWVESLRSDPNQEMEWKKKPSCISDNHWHDLYTGSLFFATRDAAIHVLDILETLIGNQPDTQLSLDNFLPDNIKKSIATLREKAQIFLNQDHKDELANVFCRECIDNSDSMVIMNIVRRDEQVLRLRGRFVSPGPAFKGQIDIIKTTDETLAEKSEEVSSKTINFPEGISNRIENLFLLNADLNGEIAEWLGQRDTDESNGEEQ